MAISLKRPRTTVHSGMFRAQRAWGWEEVAVYHVLALVGVAMLCTALQWGAATPLLSALAWLATSFYFWRKRARSFAFPPVTVLFVLISLALLVWVGVSAFIPERDHDAFMTWMPKAKALAFLGYVPAVPSSDPSYTLHPDYPLGFVSLSGAVHSVLPFFSPRLHRILAAVQAMILWAGFFRLFEREGESGREWKFLLLALPQLPIWANGYHDAAWAMAACLGIGWAWGRNDVERALPWLLWAGLGKFEGLMIVCLFVPLLAFLMQRARLLWACVPALLWLVVCYALNLKGEVKIHWPPHAVSLWLPPLVEQVKSLFLFRTQFGLTSVLLLLTVLYSWRGGVHALWLPIASALFLLSLYTVSGIDPAWHIQHSVQRVLLFPLACGFILTALNAGEPRHRISILEK